MKLDRQARKAKMNMLAKWTISHGLTALEAAKCMDEILAIYA